MKEKSLEDIRNSPFQEIELQEFSNDAKTKVVKSKKKISIKHKRNNKAKPKNKNSNKMFEVKISQEKFFIINENKDNKTYLGKKISKNKKAKKESKTENNNLNNNSISYSYDYFDFREIRPFDNHITPIFPWNKRGSVNINYQSLNADDSVAFGRRLSD